MKLKNKNNEISHKQSVTSLKSSLNRGHKNITKCIKVRSSVRHTLRQTWLWVPTDVWVRTKAFSLERWPSCVDSLFADLPPRVSFFMPHHPLRIRIRKKEEAILPLCLVAAAATTTSLPDLNRSARGHFDFIQSEAKALVPLKTFYLLYRQTFYLR